MRVAVFITMISMLLVAPLGAQGKDDIPAGFRPPAGMCRIWIDGVPPGRQPAPTDCSTAIRRRPPNARVIFGDQGAQPPSRGYQPPARSYREEPKESERSPRRSEPQDRKEEPRRAEPKREPAPSRPPPRTEPPRRDPPEVQPSRASPRFQRNDPAG